MTLSRHKYLFAVVLAYLGFYFFRGTRLIHPIWSVFFTITTAIGNFMSGLFLVIFYYTVFAIFAIPFKIFSHPLDPISSSTNWQIKKKMIETLEDYKFEY